MCRAIEDMRTNKAIEIALRLIKRGKSTLEEIAEDTGLSIAKIQELAGQQAS